MATQAETLAAKVTAANAALIDTVHQCSDDDWRTHCPGEARLVGVLAHHVALAYGPIAGMAQAAADGEAPELPTLEALAAMNAHQVTELANVGRDETVELLRRNGAAAAALVGGLSDVQLARTFTAFGGQEWTVAFFIESAVAGHAAQHLDSIRDTLAA